MGLFFTREEAEAIAPASVRTDTTAEFFAGAWRAAFALQDGYVLPADVSGDDTLVYIEGMKALLRDAPFGYEIVDLTYENGTMTCIAGEAAVLLEMQEDGNLRLTVTAEGQEETRVLRPTLLGDEEPTRDTYPSR